MGKINLMSLVLVVNDLNLILKIIVCAFASIAFIYSRNYMIDRKLFKSECFSLYLFSILGLLLLISSNDFIVLYLGLELFSLPLYALIAFEHSRQNALEASVKYFIMGALSSAILLYGISLLYGTTGIIDFDTGIKVVEHAVVFKISLLFILIWLLFKLGNSTFSYVGYQMYMKEAPALLVFL